ncbi:MAG: TetR/AcrR family transcriptional regulator [Myxococcales bacterium]|nr:TetR/AcrR family transcriptional regulator [Myxococcales bacterium]
MMNAQDRKRQEREARRHRIQDAARPVFFERGFARASIEDIAKQAQLSVGAIYLYFKSKEDLYLSILERSLRAVGDSLASADDPRSAWDTLSAWRAAEPESARALAMVARPELRATLTQDVADGLAVAIHQVRSALIASVTRAEANRIYRTCDAGAVGEALWATFLGACAVEAAAVNVGGSAPVAADLFGVIDGSLRATQVRAAA